MVCSSGMCLIRCMNSCTHRCRQCCACLSICLRVCVNTCVWVCHTCTCRAMLDCLQVHCLCVCVYLCVFSVYLIVTCTLSSLKTPSIEYSNTPWFLVVGILRHIGIATQIDTTINYIVIQSYCTHTIHRDAYRRCPYTRIRPHISSTQHGGQVRRLYTISPTVPPP